VARVSTGCCRRRSVAARPLAPSYRGYSAPPIECRRTSSRTCSTRIIRQQLRSLFGSLRVATSGLRENGGRRRVVQTLSVRPTSNPTT
jgi:hypothetical protein